MVVAGDAIHRSTNTEKSMGKPSELVNWFFLFLQTKSAMLMRIEFLVVVIVLLYLLMFFLDLWRRRSRSSAIKYILLILDAIADSTFLYTMGLMQNAPFENDLFPVWAIVLVNLRFNGCFISAYGIPDQENRRFSELSSVIALSALAFLNFTRNSKFKHPVWAMWALQLVRTLYAIYAYMIAINSSLHGRSSAFITVSLPASDHADDPPEVDLTTMAGYDFPVSGDQKQVLRVMAPEYNFARDNTGRMVTALEAVWSSLSSHTGNDVELIKDVCLSFSLYRLLRCRFDNFSLPNDRVKKTRKLMRKIMEDGDGWKRMFRIIESELAFVNDYFYTTYPVIFFRGFPLLATLYPVASIAVTCWLGRDIHIIYEARPGEAAHIIGGVNIDVIITWVFMVVIVLKEFWKMITLLLSDWTKVMVLCQCIQEKSVRLPKWLREHLICLLCTPRLKIVQRWHRKIDQYEFLQSYAYSPWSWKLLFYLSLGMIPKEADGVKLGKAIQLPEEVKLATLKSICSLDLEEDCLKEDDIPSLNANMIGSRFQWAFKLPTCAHTILVWHIATSMCEIELSKHYNTTLANSEVLCALNSAKRCCSSQPYIIKLQRLEDALRANYSVANSISRYCAYLITSVPELLPDSSFVPELVLQRTISEASKLLDGCDNLQSIYRRLMREGERQDSTADDHPTDDATQSKCCKLRSASCFRSGNEAAEGESGEDNNGNRDKPDTIINMDEGEHQNQGGGDGDDRDAVHQEKIITMGARLGRSLIQSIEDDVARWKLVAEVWADLLVHIAPSWNTEAHKRFLSTGGEFITHIWSILSHCGIQGSKLWQQQEEVREEAGHATNQQPGATGGHQDHAQQQAAPNVHHALETQATRAADQLRARRASSAQSRRSVDE